MAVGYYQE